MDNLFFRHSNIKSKALYTMTTIILNRNLWTSMVVAVMALSFAGNLNAGCVYAGPILVKELDIGNMLSWTTLQEAQNKSFIVQKSMDGEVFETVGSIKGAGDSESEMKYRYLDIATGEVRVFYRLLQMDFDGQESHTETVLVNRQKENNFIVTAMSSTMTDGIFSLALRSDVENALDYRVVNARGQAVKTGTFEVVNGGNMIAINLKEVAEGRYRFEMKVKDETEHIFIRKVKPSEMPVINYAVKE